MAQLQLFPPTPAHRHAPPAQVSDPAGHRCRAYRVPIYRVTLVRESFITAPVPRLRGAQQAAELLRQYLGAMDREHFVVILLDRKNTPIGINTVSIGSLTASVVHMRETFKVAILANAAAILCGHNHPSGDPEPSRDDRALTQRLVDAGKLLGIPLVDHVVIGDGTTASFSFADHGLF
jgi:DNA repair protein RadC